MQRTSVKGSSRCVASTHPHQIPGSSERLRAASNLSKERKCVGGLATTPGAKCPCSSELRAADKGRDPLVGGTKSSDLPRAPIFSGIHSKHKRSFIESACCFFGKTSFSIRSTSCYNVQMRDVQRNKVYNWEDALPLKGSRISRRKCSFSRCVELIDEACALYRVPEIKVKRADAEQDFAAYNHEYDSRYIEIPPSFQRQDIALHEAAHYIVDMYWPEYADHGVVFVSVYMHLLHQVLGMDYEELAAWADFMKVKFSRRKNYAPESARVNSSMFLCDDV